MRRIVVIGTTGSGKSTVAGILARRVGLEPVELDAFNHGPNWTPRPREAFLCNLRQVAERPAWVVDGNYLDRAPSVLWRSADVIVWLDLPLVVLLGRIVRRTIVRVVRRDELWNGNRESWGSLLGRHSLVVFAVRSHRRHRRELPILLAPPRLQGPAVVRLRTRREVARWLTATDELAGGSDEGRRVRRSEGSSS